MDPVKRAQEELDALLAEQQTTAPALDANGNPAGSAPVDDGIPAAVAAEADTPAATNPAEQPQPAVEKPEHDAAYWQARFEIVQGKYNAEVPRLSAEVASLKRQLDAALVQTQPELDANGEYRSKHISDGVRATRAYKKMAEEFGTDYAENHFEASAVTAQEAARAEMQPVREEAAAGAKDRLHSDIDRLSPNWMQTNDDPQFIQWAQVNRERYSGLPLIDILNDAYSQGDAVRVATVFNDYHELKRNHQPTNQQTPPDPNALIAPSNRGSASQTVDNNKGKVWTESEAETTLDAIIAGRIKGAQAKELEAEITKAYGEGRVLAR